MGIVTRSALLEHLGLLRMPLKELGKDTLKQEFSSSAENTALQQREGDKDGQVVL